MEVEKLKYIVSLINDGDPGEALKEFKRYFGIVNKFKCSNCYNITDNSDFNFRCPECGHKVNSVTILENTQNNKALKSDAPTVADCRHDYEEASICIKCGFVP